MFNKVKKVFKYYTCDIFNNQELLKWRLSFDNLLIGKEEANIAKSAISFNDIDLIIGNNEEDYRVALSQYLGVDSDNIYLFYTAHGGLNILLKELKKTNSSKQKVVVPAFTCTVVINAITKAGLYPIFVDIETETFGIDILSLQNVLKENNDILAVINQHLFGFVCRDYEAIVDLCNKEGITTIGDCAQSLGTLYKEKSVGLLEDYAIFSSQASKSINTYTGGILIDNGHKIDLQKCYKEIDYPDEETIRNVLKAYLFQFNKKKVNKWFLPIFLFINRKNQIPSLHPIELMTYSDEPLSINDEGIVYVARMPEILCKIGLVQLSRLEENIKKRNNDKEELEGILGSSPYVVVDSRPSVLRISYIKKQEDNMCEGLLNMGWLVGTWFPYSFGDCSNAMEMSEKLINYVKLSDYYVNI